MTVQRSARKLMLRGADAMPWVVGSFLLLWGLRGSPSFTLSGSIVLGLAGLLHLASVYGYATTRLGRVRAATRGIWEVPFAFYVRHRGQGLLFYRAFDPGSGELPEEYCVIAVPTDCDEHWLKMSGFEPPEESRLIGVVPVDALRFEHRRGTCVDAASLTAALRRVCAPAPAGPEVRA